MKLTTNGLTGKQWLVRLKKNKYNISKWAEQIIGSPDFDAARLPKGTELNIEFVKVADLGKTYATAQELRDYAKGKGWRVPSPEVSLLIRESVSDEEMEKMDIWYIAGLHDPIKDAGGSPGVLYARRNGDGRWVYANWGKPESYWSAGGSFAFVVPGESQPSDLKSSDPALGALELRVKALEDTLEAVRKALKV